MGNIQVWFIPAMMAIMVVILLARREMRKRACARGDHQIMRKHWCGYSLDAPQGHSGFRAVAYSLHTSWLQCRCGYLPESEKREVHDCDSIQSLEMPDYDWRRLRSDRILTQSTWWRKA